MFLTAGYSNDIIIKNINNLIECGYSREFAVSLAMDYARRFNDTLIEASKQIPNPDSSNLLKPDTQIVYHGSKAVFDSFKSEFLGSNQGNRKYGNGIYCYSKVDLVIPFIHNRDTGVIYELLIPSDKYLIHMDLPLNTNQVIFNKIKHTKEFNVLASKHEESDKFISGDITGMIFYIGLVRNFGGHNFATDFLLKQGIPGAKHVSDIEHESPGITPAMYIMYDLSKTKILNKYQLRVKNKKEILVKI